MAAMAAAAGLPAGDPFETMVAALERKGLRFSRRTSNQVRCQCPAHPDRCPSLVVSRGETGVVFKCFAGCNWRDVLRALGLTPRTLFPAGPRLRLPVTPIASYDYVDAHGLLVAQKRRFLPKRFSWRRPAGSDKGWLTNLDGVTPGLYRLPDLVDERRLFLVEGEKAVDRLWTAHLPATCPPHGANKWKPDWSGDLSRYGCRELVILPDADQPGRSFAERVAQTTWDLDVPDDCRMTIKVIALPGLSGGADVFDWLEEGGTAAQLLRIVSSATPWEPGPKERARVERRRLLGKERSRRFRERQRLR